jgi:hypothetical protein
MIGTPTQLDWRAHIALVQSRNACSSIDFFESEVNGAASQAIGIMKIVKNLIGRV